MRCLCVALVVTLAVLARTGSAATVDNLDSSIAYEPSSAWFIEDLSTSVAYDGSVSGSNSSGASASYTFTGTSFQFYGRTGPRSGTGTVTFDGTEYTCDFNDDPGVVDTLIFSKSGLTNGQHTFLLTNTDAGKYVWIDRLVYGTSSSSSGSSSGSSSSPSSSSSSSSSISSKGTSSTVTTSSFTTVVSGKTITTDTAVATTADASDSAQESDLSKNDSSSDDGSSAGVGGSSDHQDTSNSSSSNSGKGSQVGAIVGGVVGGVAVAATIGSLLLWYFKRRKQNQNVRPPISIIDENGQDYSDQNGWARRFSVNPFIAPAQNYQNMDGNSHGSGSQHFVTRSESSRSQASESNYI